MPTKALSRIYEKNPSAPMFLDKGETTSAKFVALAIPSIEISAQKGKEWKFVMYSLSHQKKRISCGSVLLILRPCKCFCSCGGQEHRALRPSNLFIADPNCVM